MKRKTPGFKFWPVLVLLAVTLLLGARGRTAPTVTAATTWNQGDVFVAVGGGQYKVYNNNGTFKETIGDPLGLSTTGCAFDPNRTKLYTTNFFTTKVKVYNRASPHTMLQTIDTALQSPGGHSESIVFAADGSFYVGHADGDRDIHKYNAAGVFQTKFNVATGPRGSDWIDLAADQKTMFYTSEGGLIRRYDVSGAGAQLADFANIGGISYALRLLPPGDGSGGLLVARNDSVKKLDSTGAVVASWDVTDQNLWFALDLDPDGEHFWAGDVATGNFYKFRLNTPGMNTHVLTVNTGTGFGTLGGICVLGNVQPLILPDLTVAQSPDQNPVSVGSTLTYIVVVKNQGTKSASGVLLTDTLPSQTQFVPADSTPQCRATGNVVSCTVGNLPAQESKTVKIAALVFGPVGNILNNTVDIDPNDTIVESDETNNRATNTAEVVAPARPRNQPHLIFPFSAPTDAKTQNWVIISGFNNQGTHGTTIPHDLYAFDLQRCVAADLSNCDHDHMFANEQNGATKNEPVRAAADGKVVKFRDEENTGCIAIRHNSFLDDNGKPRWYFTKYCHLEAPIPVRDGQPVKQGDPIGRASNTSTPATCSQRCPNHIHFSFFSAADVSATPSTRRAEQAVSLPAVVLRDEQGNGPFPMNSWPPDGTINQYRDWLIAQP